MKYMFLEFSSKLKLNTVNFSFKYYLIFSFICITLLIYLLIKVLDDNENKNLKERLNGKVEETKLYKFSILINKINFYKYLFSENRYKEMNRKLKILNYFYKEIYISIEIFSFISSLSFLNFGILLVLITGWNIFFTILISFILGVYTPYFIIDSKFDKRQKKFEEKISIIGLILKQMTSLNKNIHIILNALSKSNDKIISTEFKIIYDEYLNNNDVRRGIEKISERYPSSLYLKSVKELLLIYVEHQKDICNEIDTLIKEIESFEKIKKKIQVEFAKQDKTIIMLIVISVSFIGMFITTNDVYKKFYMSRFGISVLLGSFIYIFAGLCAIYLFKLDIVKDKKAQSIKIKNKEKK